MSFKITSMFRDCLSHQIGEALRINHSRDRILNSKNEYIQNCISRITVQEDMLERKARLAKKFTDATLLAQQHLLN